MSGLRQGAISLIFLFLIEGAISSMQALGVFESEGGANIVGFSEPLKDHRNSMRLLR